MDGLVIDNVSMVFTLPNGGEVHALEDVSLHLKPGELMAVLGPSGCGKTTLLNIVGGFLAPTAGQALLNGHQVTGPHKERGVVFQQGALFEWMTVAQNVSFGPRMCGVPRAEIKQIVSRLLDTVALKGFADKPVYQLSGGMQQRVALARCLANDPDVILMDEPLGALDALTREKMQGLVLKLWKETGKTIVLITHSVEGGALPRRAPGGDGAAPRPDSQGIPRCPSQSRGWKGMRAPSRPSPTSSPPARRSSP